MNHVNVTTNCPSDSASQPNYHSIPTPNSGYSMQRTLDARSIVPPKISNCILSMLQLFQWYLGKRHFEYITKLLFSLLNLSLLCYITYHYNSVTKCLESQFKKYR